MSSWSIYYPIICFTFLFKYIYLVPFELLPKWVWLSLIHIKEVQLYNKQ